jgi:hypothetical protein
MNVHDYLRTCRELSGLCTQNGWIDNDTLRVQIVEKRQDRVIAAVQFDEIIMEGAGCIAGRIPCFGHVHMYLDQGGAVVGMDIPD